MNHITRSSAQLDRPAAQLDRPAEPIDGAYTIERMPARGASRLTILIIIYANILLLLAALLLTYAIMRLPEG